MCNTGHGYLNMEISARVKSRFNLALKTFGEDTKTILRESGATIIKYPSGYTVTGSRLQLQDFAYRLLLLQVDTSKSDRRSNQPSARSAIDQPTTGSPKQNFETVFESCTITSTTGSTLYQRICQLCKPVLTKSSEFVATFDILKILDDKSVKSGSGQSKKKSYSAKTVATPSSATGRRVEANKHTQPSSLHNSANKRAQRHTHRNELPQGANTTDLGVFLQTLHFNQTNRFGLQISCSYGDITRESVDVIVNATNRYLRHEGGVSKAIVTAGGDIIRSESNRLIKSKGPLSMGEICHTRAGLLSCQHIIHAVGPKWKKGKDTARRILHDLLISIFHYASYKLDARSIAIPPISAGTNGMPNDICANIFHTAVEEFSSSRKSTRSSLRDIRILTMDRDTAKSFVTEFSNAGHHGRVLQTRQPSYSTDSSATVPSATPSYQSAAKKASHRYTTSNSDTGQVLGAVSGTQYGGSDFSFPQSTYSGLDTQTYISTGASGVSITPPFNTSRFVAVSAFPAASTRDIASSSGKGDCPICVSDYVYLKSMNCCQNTICENCFDRHFTTDAKCPFCTTIVLQKDGDQPDGTMTYNINHSESLPGFQGDGLIKISYEFRDGIQTSRHPSPGQRYTGTSRHVYLPANREGREVLGMLQEAFDRRLLFTIGRSVTTGQDNCVVWNDIHQKTSKTGGPAKHGYPDSGYLRRVKDELAAKGIK